MVGKKIAIVTSGGDAPGMNAAIATIAKIAEKRKIPVVGIRHGYLGVSERSDFISLNQHSVAGILRRSGTILGSARLKGLESSKGFQKWAKDALPPLIKMGIRALIVLGGDGSLEGATEIYKFYKEGKFPMLVVGIPCSVDNDVPGTDFSIGSDTAVNSTMKLMDSLVGTAYSHGRTFLVETMGAKAGYLALMAALTGEAEAVYIPERKEKMRLGWRHKLFGELQNHFKRFVVEGDPPEIYAQKTQATIVFAEAFCRMQEDNLETEFASYSLGQTHLNFL